MKRAGKALLLRARRLAILLTAVAGVSSAVVAVAGAATQASADQVSCHSSTAQVALAAGQSASYTVAGYFCATPETANGANVAQFLIHGGTYNHDYWDFGTVDGIQYSYARQVASAGIPTFFIDQIGAGASSHPASSDVTLQAMAYVAHQIIQGLKGAAGGVSFRGVPRFKKVVEVGHCVHSRC